MDPYWLLGLCKFLYGDETAPAELLEATGAYWKKPQVFVAINFKKKEKRWKAWCIKVFWDRELGTYLVHKECQDAGKWSANFLRYLQPGL